MPELTEGLGVELAEGLEILSPFLHGTNNTEHGER